MYPLGKGNYPTLVQKHFNGAVPRLSSGIDTKTQKCSEYYFDMLLLPISKEATVLAKWLKGVTVAVAHARPGDEHAMFLFFKSMFVCALYACSSAR